MAYIINGATGSGISGPLQGGGKNSRYFTDGTGAVVYLTGSHTWANLQDGLHAEGAGRDPAPPFDYTAYLDLLESHNHNFIRLWMFELPKTDFSKNVWLQAVFYPSPLSWMRTGPEPAADGKPQFDLERLNPDYFARLRARVMAAGERGIYVSVMLFEGWSYDWLQGDLGWEFSPFNIRNNINGISGADDESNTSGLKTHSLLNPRITAVQKAYVQRVLETLSDLDNVLYEISNEDSGDTMARDWQYAMIRFIKETERGSGKRSKLHPVGMSATGVRGIGWRNDWLRNSPADFIFPGQMRDEDFKVSPPLASPAFTADKVVILDTDHIWGIGGQQDWVWKAFTRGYNVIYMDPYGMTGYPDDTVVDLGMRPAMGDTRYYADKMDLASMLPSSTASSTGYCLLHPGEEYLIFDPIGEGITIYGLPTGDYIYEWFNGKREAQATFTIRQSTMGDFHVPNPVAGSRKILYLKKKNASPLIRDEGENRDVTHLQQDMGR